ncbi:Con-6 family protein [Sporobolomyces salmoneus]|uniref:Con-6 family protein n=1 Tax=Sporobolomyces salmoneus TaxID=183962 RepID=UPI0031824500
MAHELRVEGDKVIESDAQGHLLSTKDYSHVHAGYVATLHNPRVSDEAKQGAEKLLHELEIAHGDTPSKISWSKASGEEGGESSSSSTKKVETHTETHAEEVHRHRQIGTYKGILHKDNVSDEAKQHAREMLKEFGVDPDEVEKEGAKK